jgi:hypothetical protein
MSPAADSLTAEPETDWSARFSQARPVASAATVKLQKRVEKS